jgi:hypothetical protein
MSSIRCRYRLSRHLAKVTKFILSFVISAALNCASDKAIGGVLGLQWRHADHLVGCASAIHIGLVGVASIASLIVPRWLSDNWGKKEQELLME